MLSIFGQENDPVHGEFIGVVREYVVVLKRQEHRLGDYISAIRRERRNVFLNGSTKGNFGVR
jgi:hypothetical protein